MSSNNSGNGNPGGNGDPPEQNPGLGQQKRADPSEVVSRAKSERDSVQSELRSAAEWFHDYYENEGDLLNREEAVTKIEQHLGVEHKVAARIVANLIGDIVDPITQITTLDDKFVGILDYEEGHIYYTYKEHDDVLGERRVVVCAQCVHEAEHESEVTHAKEHSGSFKAATKAELVQAVRDHFDKVHADTDPADVETGATLLSGTTIGGNTAFHTGNDGPGSGLDADTVDGLTGDTIDRPPLDYGSGADGSTTNPSTLNAGVYNYTTFEVQNANTTTVNGLAIVFCTQSATINGTLDGDGNGASGGTGGSSNQGAGSNGGNGLISPIGNGGAGGQDSGSGGGDGGDGGDGDLGNSTFSISEILQSNPQIGISAIHHGTNSSSAGAGGGGGGGGVAGNGDFGQDNGQFPGGGGQGDNVSDDGETTSSSGGDGGNGGAGIIIVAPEISGSGTITMDAQDGQNGNGGGTNDAGGGGGGGGSGGCAILVGEDLSSESVTVSAAGGTGGTGGGGARDGADGEDGTTAKIEKNV